MFTLGWAIFGSVIMAGIIGVNAWRTHGMPVEHLTAIEVDKQLSTSCDGYRHVQLHQWVVTWRSSDPPPGMRKTFRSIECSSWSVGETARWVRMSDDRQTEVLPPEDGSLIEYVEGFAVGGLVALPFLFVGRLGWITFALPWLGQVRARRRSS